MILGRTHIRTVAPLGTATRQCLHAPQVKWNVHILLSLLTRAALFQASDWKSESPSWGMVLRCRCKRSANRVGGYIYMRP